MYSLINQTIKGPARDACLSMGENQAPPFRFPYNSVTVGRILFKYGRCMQ